MGIISRPELQQGTIATHNLKSQAMISWLELYQGKTATHHLESQKQARDQQARIATRHHSHSLPEEPWTGMISRLELQQGTAATHHLESQGQA